jgi:hypothetical membrane protein
MLSYTNFSLKYKILLILATMSYLLMFLGIILIPYPEYRDIVFNSGMIGLGIVLILFVIDLIKIMQK